MQVAVSFGWPGRVPSFALVTLLFLYFATAVIYGYLHRLRGSTSFIQFYLFLMVVKLVGYLGYNVVIVVKHKPGAMANVVFFLLVYFVFTVLEISFLYGAVNNEKQSGNSPKKI